MKIILNKNRKKKSPYNRSISRKHDRSKPLHVDLYDHCTKLKIATCTFSADQLQGMKRVTCTAKKEFGKWHVTWIKTTPKKTRFNNT